MLADLRDDVRRYALHILLAALAALVATLGFVMLMVSAFLRLGESMAAPAAAAVTGGIVLVLAGLIALAAQRFGHGTSRKRVPETARPSVTDSASGIAELLIAAEAAIGADARSKTPRFALMALLAGCAIGASPRLRRALADLIR
ncbi:MAG: phage holin family protein [Rhodospirillales bacterium]|nr:phage holin family protein [Rhodospirillales bacterium]